MGYRILLADDSLTIQKVVELTFARTDWELRTAGSGDKAAAILPEFAPDVVLADAVMPGLTGYELCEAVKRLPDGPYVPVVMLTGTFEPFDKGRAERAGADAVVTKPFDSHALLDLVRDLVERAKEAKAAAPPPPPPPPPPEPEPVPEPVAETAPLPPPPLPPEEVTGPMRVPPAWRAETAAPEEARPPDSLYATSAIPIFTPEQLDAMRPPAEPVPPSPPPAPEPPPEPFHEASAPLPPTGSTTAPVSAYEVDLGALEEETPRRDIEADIAEFERSGRVSSAMPAFSPLPAEAGMGATSVELPPSGGPLPEHPPSDLEALAARTSLNDLTRMVGAGGGADRPLADDDVERIARRVVEILGERVVRKVAWDVVPEMAERLVRERLRELERSD